MKVMLCSHQNRSVIAVCPGNSIAIINLIQAGQIGEGRCYEPLLRHPSHKNPICINWCGDTLMVGYKEGAYIYNIY